MATRTQKCADTCASKKMKMSLTNALGQLKSMTIVVADTGDFEGIF